VTLELWQLVTLELWLWSFGFEALALELGLWNFGAWNFGTLEL
jgi:hypothetical protein